MSQVRSRFNVAISEQLKALLARKVGSKNIQQLAVELLAAYVGRKDLAKLGDKPNYFEQQAEIGIVKFQSGDQKGLVEILNSVGQLIFQREIILAEKYLRWAKRAIDDTPHVKESTRELWQHMSKALEYAKDDLTEEQVWAWMPGSPESAGEFLIHCEGQVPYYVKVESPADLVDLPPARWHLKLPPKHNVR